MVGWGCEEHPDRFYYDPLGGWVGGWVGGRSQISSRNSSWLDRRGRRRRRRRRRWRKWAKWKWMFQQYWTSSPSSPPTLPAGRSRVKASFLQEEDECLFHLSPDPQPTLHYSVIINTCTNLRYLLCLKSWQNDEEFSNREIGFLFTLLRNDSSLALSNKGGGRKKRVKKGRSKNSVFLGWGGETLVSVCAQLFCISSFVHNDALCLIFGKAFLFLGRGRVTDSPFDIVKNLTFLKVSLHWKRFATYATLIDTKRFWKVPACWRLLCPKEFAVASAVLDCF